MVCALAACGDDRPNPGFPPDAQTANLSCFQQPLPQDAPDPVTLSGAVYEPGVTAGAADVPVDGAAVRAYHLDSGALVAQSTTGGDGGYALVMPSGGAPVPVRVEVVDARYRTSRVGLPTAVFDDRVADLPVFGDDHMDALANFAGIALDPDAAIVVAQALDCDLVPLAGVTIASAPAPVTALYLASNGLPNYNQTSTSAEGAIVMVNVPVGTVELTAELDGSPLRATTIEAVRYGDGVINTAALVP